MAMKTRVGLYWRLKDKSLPWIDRVKLARYIWKEDSVNFPNKEQVVLDWLSLVLSGKIRVPEEESVSVWRCLNDVLRTSKCMKDKFENQTLTLKSSLIQVMLEKLKKGGKGSAHQELILSSFYSIQKSTQLSPALVSKYENILQLTCSVIDAMCATQESDWPPFFCNLLSLSLTNLDAAQKLRANAQQVISLTSQSMLLPACRLLPHLSSYVQLSDQLQSTLLAGLLSKDLSSFYEIYVKSQTEPEQSKSSPPKFIESMFKKFSEGLSDADFMDGVIILLPKYLARYAKTFNHPENSQGFHMFICLATLLGLDWDPGSQTLKPSETDRQKLQLRGLVALLDVVGKENIYDMAVDASWDNRHLGYLKAIAQWLLQSDTRNTDWYVCIQMLLRLNYMIFEAKLIKLVQASWTKVQMSSDEIYSAKSTMLRELVLIYTRLRQIPKLFKRILEAVMAEGGVKPGITIPSAMKEALGDTISSLPQTVVTSVWEDLLDLLISLSTQMKSNAEVVPKFLFISDLLVILAENARLVDYSITSNTVKIVQGLMERMSDALLRPLLKSFSEMKKLSVCDRSILQLLIVWGDFNVMMTKYVPNYSRSGAFKHTINHINCHDLSFTFPMLNGGEWKQVNALIEDGRSPSVTYLMECLLIRDAKAMILFHTEFDGLLLESSIKEKLSHVVGKLKESKSSAMCGVWTGELEKTDLNGAAVGSWNQVIDVLPSIIDYLNDDQLSVISHMLLFSLTRNAVDPEMPLENEVTMISVSAQFLTSPILQELRLLQHSFIHMIWAYIGELLCRKPKSPKKFKSVGGVDSVLTAIKDEVEGPELVERLNDLFEEPGSKSCTNEHQYSVSHILKVLSILPVEMMSHEIQSRVLAGCLALLTLQGLGDLTETCASIIWVILTNTRITTLLPAFNIGSLLTWFSSWSHNKEAGSQKLNLVRELLHQSVRSAQALSECEIFLSQCVKKLQIGGENLNVNGNLDMALHMYKILSENSSKSYLPDELLKGSQKHHQSMFTPFLKLVKSLSISTSPKLTKQVLEVYSKELALSLSGDKQEAEKLLKYTEKMCDICLNLMKEDGVMNRACLVFVRTVCEHREKLKNRVSEDFFTHSWFHLLSAIERGVWGERNAVDGEDNVKEPVDGDICDEACNCLIKLMSVSDTSGFRSSLILLLKSVRYDVAIRQPAKVSMVMRLWRHLAVGDYDEEKFEVFRYYTQQLIGQLHELAINMSSASIARDDHVELTIDVLETQTQLLAQGPMLLSGQSAVQTLHAAHHAPLNGLALHHFSSVIHGIHGNLNALIISHPDVAVKVIPTIMSNASLILEHVIFAGRQRNEDLTEQDVSTLVSCAHLMDRLCGLMLLHKVDFARVALYLIADYTNHVQKVTLIPKVKNALLPAVYSLLDLCDTHAIAQLHTVLPIGVKEVFKSVYDQYTRYHKYTGRV